MTSIGPYTQATLLVDPSVDVAVKVTTPGTVLDYVARFHPAFFQEIAKCQLLPFYDQSTGFTLFIPLLFDTGVSSYKRVKNCTFNGVFTTSMMTSSSRLVLYSLGDSVTVTSRKGEIWMDNSQILYGDVMCTNGIVHVVSADYSHS